MPRALKRLPTILSYGKGMRCKTLIIRLLSRREEEEFA